MLINTTDPDRETELILKLEMVAFAAAMPEADKLPQVLLRREQSIFINSSCAFIKSGGDRQFFLSSYQPEFDTAAQKLEALWRYVKGDWGFIEKIILPNFAHLRTNLRNTADAQTALSLTCALEGFRAEQGSFPAKLEILEREGLELSKITSRPDLRYRITSNGCEFSFLLQEPVSESQLFKAPRFVVEEATGRLNVSLETE